MKLIAFYLPQFHEIQENNQWWGKGFTEWNNVKKAKSFFWMHNQPRYPLDNNYYNLLNIETIKWQVKLAKKFGIYGFCFYHYWFGGRKLLEKPVENLLNNQEIKIPFCFSWANEPWTRTWHGAGGEKEILMRQEYGGINEWKEHFYYLIDFFKDERYIKKDNKPMFLIYRTGYMERCNDMLKLWNDMAIECGFSGMHFVNMLTVQEKYNRSKYLEATVDFEPGRTRRENIIKIEKFSLFRKKLLEKDISFGIFNRLICNVIDYDKVNLEMLNKVHKKNEYRGVFVDYDDTPRRGLKGIIFRGSTPDKFKKYLSANIKNSCNEGNEFLFVNAWNEWGESNYLEPDKKSGYAYLKAVKRALNENTNNERKN